MEQAIKLAFLFNYKQIVICILYFRRCLAISKDSLINEQITHKELRVIDEDGEQLGLLSLDDAMERAIAKNLDLVLIAPKAVPPVCKIMDYGKYRFEQAKREKELKKNQKIIELKEIRLSVNIDTHDFNTKLGHAKRFLAEGDKVKVSVRFRGREMSHTSLGADILKKFAQDLSDIASTDKPPKLEGRSMTLILSGKPSSPK